MASKYNYDDDYDEISSQASSHVYESLQDWRGTSESSESDDYVSPNAVHHPGMVPQTRYSASNHQVYRSRGPIGYVPPQLQGRTQVYSRPIIPSYMTNASSLSDGVSRSKLTGTSKQSKKKSLYRCDLKAKIEKQFFWSGVDVSGSEIFVACHALLVSYISVYNIKGGFVRDIKCSELKHAWNLKVCDNLLYVTDCAEDKKVVLIMDRNGNVKSRIGLPGDEVGLFRSALGLAIDEMTKNIYVSSYNTNTVYKCPHGKDHFKPFTTYGLSGPDYLCVDHHDEVIVSNGGSHTVNKYSIDGRLIWRYGEKGSGNGQLNRPLGVSTDPFGNVYVADCINNRVVQISPDGKFKSNINIGEVIEKPLGIIFKDNRLIITTGLIGERMNENKIYVVKCQFVNE